MNRHGVYGGTLLAVAALLAGPAIARAQSTDLLGGSVLARGQIDTTYHAPVIPADNPPIPTGNPGTHGFYTGIEFMLLTQTRPLGDQVVAYRGLVDSQGLITGVPGTYIGSGVKALETDSLGRRSFHPGFNIVLGYKLDDGTSIYVSYMNLLAQEYIAGATLAAPYFRSRLDLSDTFLVSGVFNFPPDYAGALLNTVADDTNRNGIADPGEGTNFYGIWNGASVMDITFKQWFTQAEVGVRVPLFQTEYSRIYGLAGGRFNWFFERFTWRTIEYDILGNAGPRQVADYSNTLSQRMYGAFFGCGHEVYLGKQFSLSLDLTAAGLLNVIKERAKYELGDDTARSKRSRNDYSVVPSGTAHLNLWWYPLQGVQLRVGYNAWTFFNTRYMNHPIGFNYGAIDPVYETKAFRIVHGINAGVALFF